MLRSLQFIILKYGRNYDRNCALIKRVTTLLLDSQLVLRCAQKILK